MTLQLPDANVLPRKLDDTREQLDEIRKTFESVQRNIDVISMQFPVGNENLANAVLTNSLPTSPRNGHRVLYQPSVGVVWDLVFDQNQHDADATGWVVVGGQPLQVTTGLQASNGSTTWAAGGLTLAIPIAGSWDVTLAARLYASVADSASELSTSGAGTTVGATMTLSALAGGGTFTAQHNMFTWRHTLTVGTLVEQVRRGTGSGTAYADNRAIRAMPVRLAS